MTQPGLTDLRQPLHDFLHNLGILWQGLEHPPLHTVEESRAWRGDQLPGPHLKSLFLKDKKGNRFLVVAEETRPINLKSLHRHIGGSGRLSFCKGEELFDTLGVRPGSATPFALMNDTDHKVKAVFDDKIFDGDFINAHPLDNEATITVTPDQMHQFVAACGHDAQMLDFDSLDEA